MPFVLKLNTSGVPIYVDNVSVSSTGTTESIAAFGDSAVFSGYFRGAAMCGTTSFSATNIQDIFIATVKSGVGFINAISISGSGSYNEKGWRIVVDNNRNIILNGLFESSISIGSTTLTSSGGSYEGFIAKYGNPLCTTSIDEINNNGNLQLNIFPNPVSGILNVSLKESNTIDLSILNTLGQTIIKKQLPKNNQENIQLNISSLPSGIYIIQVTGKNNSATAKFIKE